MEKVSIVLWILSVDNIKTIAIETILVRANNVV